MMLLKIIMDIIQKKTCTMLQILDKVDKSDNIVLIDFYKCSVIAIQHFLYLLARAVLAFREINVGSHPLFWYERTTLIPFTISDRLLFQSLWSKVVFYNHSGYCNGF